MSPYLTTIPFLAALILAWGTAFGDAGNPGVLPAALPEGCLASHYPDFKGGEAVWGFMPGPTEREAICRYEFDSPDARLAREEMGSDDKSPLTLELRKLWLMERIKGQADGAIQGGATVFSRTVARNSLNKLLGIKPGIKPQQVPHLDTSAKRERLPDLSRTLDSGKAPKIYYFRRSDERVAAVCVEPGEGGSCREIVDKEQYERKLGKKVGEEEKGFKGFMKKVKSSFTGPPPREITEWKNVDFYGVRLVDVAYAFDYDLAYIGFFARVAVRRPFTVDEDPQYIRDVFGSLIRQFGEPALKWKGHSGKAGVAASQAIWLTADGFRIDAICENREGDKGVCRDGRIAVRRLPPLRQSRSVEGAEFFE